MQYVVYYLYSLPKGILSMTTIFSSYRAKNAFQKFTTWLNVLVVGIFMYFAYVDSSLIYAFFAGLTTAYVLFDVDGRVERALQGRLFKKRGH